MNLLPSLTQLKNLHKFKNLSFSKRLTILETALHILHKELQQGEMQPTSTEHQEQLVAVAKLLLSDYVMDEELTLFTRLDSEDFYE